jgi:hypothetical protein
VRLLDHSIVVSEIVTEKVNTIKEATIRGIVGEDCRISKDAHNWLLQLRDGRNIVLLVMCHCGGRVPSVVSHRSFSENEKEEPIAPMGFSDDDEEAILSVFDGDCVGFTKANDTVQGIDMGEESLIWVEPLVMKFPPEAQIGAAMEDGKQQEESDWAL